MFSVIVMIFEAVAVLFIGIFARADDSTLTTTNASLLTDSLTLMLAFLLMYSPFRRLSLYTIVTYLLALALAAQTNLLFGTFWDSCFTSFQDDFQVNVTLLIRCAFAAFAVLLTLLDFAGLFGYWEVYFLIAPIMTIGYSFNSAVIVYGLDCFDGGGGLTVFMYSGVCSLMIWLLSIRGKIDQTRYKIRESYINHVLGFIGVAVAFICWPKFNMGGALISYINANASTITSSTFLQNSALGNTMIGLTTAVLLSCLFASKDSKEDKLKYKVYIDCFVNGGIVIASYQDIALNPVAGMVMVSLSTIATLIINKYFLTASVTDAESAFKTMMINYGKIVYRILFSFLGIIVAAIVVSTRSSRDPALLSERYSKKAGYEIVAWITVLGVGAVFGLICGLVINCFLSYKKAKLEEQGGQAELPRDLQLQDSDYFMGLNDEMHPLYYDIFQTINKKESEKINIKQYTTKVIKQSLLGASDNPLRSMSGKDKSVDKARPNDDETAQNINKSFSRNNRGDVSVMKSKPRDEEEFSNKQEERVYQPIKESRVMRSSMKELPVQRRLDYNDDFGSEIKEENLMQSKSRARM